MHLQVLCHSMCLVSLILDIRLNNLTIMFINSITTAFALIYCNTIEIKHRLISVNTKEFTFNTLKLKKVIAMKKHFLINSSIILYYPFPLNIYECLIYHQLQ